MNRRFSRTFSSSKLKVLSTASTAALVLAGAGWATSAQAQSDVDQVVVTSSRFKRDGYDAPTPVTVLGAEQLQGSAAPSMFSVIAQLPALSGSVSPQTGNGGSSGGTGGISALGLRGLGTNRTLVLVDGQRMIGATLTGIVDVSQLPQTLVSRVDVVTGGASADWGSDAVAGVVNFVTDTRFKGFKADVSGGVTQYNDNKQYKVALTGGLSLLGDRGHLVGAVEVARTDGLRGADRPWYKGTKVLQRPLNATPVGQPQYLVRDHVGQIQIAPGGVITGGPLMGTAFGANGAVYPYQYGSLIISPLMEGGQASADLGDVSNLDNQLLRHTAYGRFSYDLGEHASAWISANYGRSHGYYQSGRHYKTGSLTIRRDNPFLPASVVAAMAAANVTTAPFGTWNADILPFEVDNLRTMKRLAGGVEGRSTFLGSEWKWNAYVETAKNNISNRNPNESITPLYNLAVDAVRSPTGQIVCRSTLTNPTNGCVPLNIIGTGVASQAALAYIMGTAYLETEQTHRAAAFTLNGEPFELWAGPVSIATGVEYRREGFSSVGDPISEGNNGNPALAAAGNNWFTGNFHGSKGAFDVYEGFVGAVVPILDSPAYGKSDISGTVRRTHYSTAGSVTTWKLGGSYAPVEDVRFRGTLSRDIRAPNLQELFQASQVFTQTVVDDFAPFAGQTFTIQRPQVGNRNLKAEFANSMEIGAVVKPRFVPELNFSVDYYRINIKNVVSTLSNQQTMDLCFQGNQTLCSLIVRNAAGQVTSLTVQAINLASQKTKGIDFEADYTVNLDELGAGAGRVNFRVLATHIIEQLTDPGIPNAPVTDSAGQNGGTSPDWRILATERYTSAGGAFTASLTERWISDGVINNAWIECTSNCPAPTIDRPTVDNNHLDGALYFDLAANYKFALPGRENKAEVYGRIDNLTNKSPPRSPGNGSLAFISPGVNASLFDTIGRVYRLGFRYEF